MRHGSKVSGLTSTASASNSYPNPRQSSKLSATGSSAPQVGSRAPTIDSECQRCRDKGLCFRCAEPFRPGHRCASTSFSLLEGDDDDLPLEDQYEADPSYTQEDTHVAFNATLKEETPVAFNAILGSSSASTMKLRGTLNNNRCCSWLIVGPHTTLSQTN